MNRERHWLNDFRLRSFIGRYPVLFFPLYCLVPLNRRLAVGRDTELVIDGFPRCANTFAVLAFEAGQKQPVRLAHHLHVPAQIIRAARLGIPTLVLTRHPRDAAVSLALREPGMTLARCLRYYAGFHDRIQSQRQCFVVGDFAEVIDCFAGVVRRINRRFGTQFTATTPEGETKRRIFERIETLGEADGALESRMSRPSAARTAMKTALASRLERPEYGALLAAAVAAYRRCLAESPPVPAAVTPRANR